MDGERFKPWGEKQERAIFTTKPILLFGAGTQAGKTTVGALRMKMKMFEFADPEDAFIITSPTYKTMMQSTLPPFLKLMQGLGTHDKKNDTFRLHGGGMCYLRTETDPDSIVGITNVRHIWGDEAGKYRLYFWENIQARADFCGATIDLTTSPYALNWIYTEIIKRVRRGERSDVEFVQAASWENPHHSLYDERKRIEKMASMDPRRFKALYGGEWNRMEGLVYDCWDDDVNFVKPFPLPTGTKFYAGVDWGFTDPFVIKVRAITPEGNHIGVSEYYKTGLVASEMVETAKRLKIIWDIKTFYCDPSQPGHIEEFNRAGLSAIGADNDIRRGIDLHYELIKTGRYREFIGACPNSADEREVYHYPEPQELRPDQDSKDQMPVGQYDHCFAADTTIYTDRGHIQIDRINPGDMVLTRKGFKRVIHRFDMGVKSVVDLGMFRCTPEHQVYTLDRSFVRADSLLDSDRYITSWRWRIRSYSWARRISYTVARGIIVVGPLGFIFVCGAIITAMFLKVSMSIIKMVTPWTIGSKTSNSLMAKSISRIIRAGIIKILKIKIRFENVWPRLDLWHLGGTGHLKALLGTLSTAGRYGALRLVDRCINYAFGAKESLKRIILWSAGRSTAIKIAKPAPDERVYDLMVEDEFEYFANGVLVSNCMDTDRYLTLALYRAHDKKSPQVPGGTRPRTRLDELKRSNRRLNYESWSK